MLDMGFRPQIDRLIARLPRRRQTMLFSATLDGEVGELARAYTDDPARVSAAALGDGEGEVAHSFTSVQGNRGKRDALLELLERGDPGLTLVFSRTKHGVKRLRRELEQRGTSVAALHGDMTQAGRQRALAAFTDGKVNVLVATDIAARGIDLADITRVVHFDAPTTREDFVHRSGRTGRAGRSGVCVTFVTSAEEADVSRLAASCGLEAEYQAAGLKMAAPRILRTGGRNKGRGGRRARSTAPPTPTPDRGNRIRRKSTPSSTKG